MCTLFLARYSIVLRGGTFHGQHDASAEHPMPTIRNVEAEDEEEEEEDGLLFSGAAAYSYPRKKRKIVLPTAPWLYGRSDRILWKFATNESTNSDTVVSEQDIRESESARLKQDYAKEDDKLKAIKEKFIELSRHQ